VKDTGGVITVRSELGEPIHKAKNRPLRLWKVYDNTVFKLPHEKCGFWLQGALCGGHSKIQCRLFQDK